jgi:hypothetical protein
MWIAIEGSVAYSRKERKERQKKEDLVFLATVIIESWKVQSEGSGDNFCFLAARLY